MKTKTYYFENPKRLKSVKILKSNYKVFSVSCLKLKKKKRNISYIGFIDYDRKEIYLKRNKYIKETLNHEIIHAIFNELSKHLNKNKRLFKKLRSNEDFIEPLSLLIFETFFKKK